MTADFPSNECTSEHGALPLRSKVLEPAHIRE